MGGDQLTVACRWIKTKVWGCSSQPLCTLAASVVAKPSARTAAENGDQRAKCLACGRTFVLEPQGARYDERFKAQVVAAYQDRMSIRGITRTFGVCQETVVRWVG